MLHTLQRLRWEEREQRLEHLREARLRVVAKAEDDRVKRCRVLAAFVEIVLASGDADAARTATEELAEFAADLDAPHLRAVVESARGAIMLASGDARAAR